MRFLLLTGKKSKEAVVSGSSSVATKEYHCPQCNETFQLSSVDVLRHKLSHKRKE